VNPKQIIAQLTIFLEKNKNATDAPLMKSYMRNQFEFLGLKKPARQLLCKEFWKKNKPPEVNELKVLVSELWESPYRELQYHALDLMYKNIKKLDSGWIDFWQELILKKSWWDSVDYLAPRLIGTILLDDPKLAATYSKKWIESDNFWLQRTAIIFQLKYKGKTNQQILFGHILRQADSKEFFIQKGSGWALREYSKTNPEAVIEFTKKHKTKLSPLTYKEALKWLIKKGNKIQ